MRQDTAAARGPHRPAAVADVRRAGAIAVRRSGSGAVVAGLSLLVPLAVLATACSFTSPGTGGGGSSQPPGATASSAAPPANSGTSGGSGAAPAAECATSGLKAVLGPAEGTAGSSYLPITFTNISSAGCTLYGYPGVSFVTGSGGSQVGNAANRIPLPNGQAHTVSLHPGEVANAVLRVLDSQNFPSSECQPADGRYLRIYPPGQTAALYVRTGFGPDAACASRAVTVLQVEPIEPGGSPPTG
jgi:hypothetical protein